MSVNIKNLKEEVSSYHFEQIVEALNIKADGQEISDADAAQIRAVKQTMKDRKTNSVNKAIEILNNPGGAKAPESPKNPKPPEIEDEDEDEGTGLAVALQKQYEMAAVAGQQAGLVQAQVFNSEMNRGFVQGSIQLSQVSAEQVESGMRQLAQQMGGNAIAQNRRQNKVNATEGMEVFQPQDVLGGESFLPSQNVLRESH